MVASGSGIAGFIGDCWLCGFDGVREEERKKGRERRERIDSLYIYIYIYYLLV